MPRRQRNCVPFKQQMPPIDEVWYPRRLDSKETPTQNSKLTPHVHYVTHSVQGTYNTNFDTNVPTAFHTRHWKWNPNKHKKIQDRWVSAWPCDATFLFCKQKWNPEPIWMVSFLTPPASPLNIRPLTMWHAQSEQPVTLMVKMVNSKVHPITNHEGPEAE
jgi:hypothetical protein